MGREDPVPFALHQQVAELVASVGLVSGARRGKLAALTIGAPAASAEEVASLVATQLSVAGHLGVEVRTRPGPLRLLALEFRR